MVYIYYNNLNCALTHILHNQFLLHQDMTYIISNVFYHIIISIVIYHLPFVMKLASYSVNTTCTKTLKAHKPDKRRYF